MATCVLVPGGWCGGWIWRAVTPALRDAGHTVYTPTLTGCGDRSHLARPETDLDTHLQDILAVLEFEELHEVVLIGWSYGGMVITGVADRAPERLAGLIYIDALVPQDGQSVFDVEANPQGRAEEEERVRTRGDGWLSAPPSIDDFRQWGADPDEVRLRWWATKLTPQPVKTLTQRLRLGNPQATAIPRTYIFCTEGKGESDATLRMAAAARSDSAWRYLELASTHLAPFVAPTALAEVVLCALQPSR